MALHWLSQTSVDCSWHAAEQTYCISIKRTAGVAAGRYIPSCLCFVGSRSWSTTKSGTVGQGGVSNSSAGIDHSVGLLRSLRNRSTRSGELRTQALQPLRVGRPCPTRCCTMVAAVWHARTTQSVCIHRVVVLSQCWQASSTCWWVQQPAGHEGSSQVTTSFQSRIACLGANGPSTSRDR
jgi:hypothetical protein